MTYAVDDVASIRARLREIRMEEGRGDDSIETAIGKDLDAIGSKAGLHRQFQESDATFRIRMRPLASASWKGSAGP